MVKVIKPNLPKTASKIQCILLKLKFLKERLIGVTIKHVMHFTATHTQIQSHTTVMHAYAHICSQTHSHHTKKIKHTVTHTHRVRQTLSMHTNTNGNTSFHIGTNNSSCSTGKAIQISHGQHFHPGQHFYPGQSNSQKLLWQTLPLVRHKASDIFQQKILSKVGAKSEKEKTFSNLMEILQGHIHTKQFTVNHSCGLWTQ